MLNINQGREVVNTTLNNMTGEAVVNRSNTSTFNTNATSLDDRNIEIIDQYSFAHMEIVLNALNEGKSHKNSLNLLLTHLETFFSDKKVNPIIAVIFAYLMINNSNLSLKKRINLLKAIKQEYPEYKLKKTIKSLGTDDLSKHMSEYISLIIMAEQICAKAATLEKGQRDFELKYGQTLDKQYDVIAAIETSAEVSIDI